MATTYVTFGQCHVHEINKQYIDKDCVVMIECDSREEGRKRAFSLFGDKWCFEYHEDEFDKTDMKYFPRGFIRVA